MLVFEKICKADWNSDLYYVCDVWNCLLFMWSTIRCCGQTNISETQRHQSSIEASQFEFDRIIWQPESRENNGDCSNNSVVRTVSVMHHVGEPGNCSSSAAGVLMCTSIYRQCVSTVYACVWESSCGCNTMVSTDETWSWWEQYFCSICVYESLPQAQQHTLTDYKCSCTPMIVCAHIAHT